MKASGTRVVLQGLLIALWVCGCSDPQQLAWQQALREDSSAAYAKYLQNYPQGLQAGLAATRAKALADQQDWQIAVQRDSSDAYQTYMNLHRDGVWRELAHQRSQVVPPPAPVEVAPAPAPAPAVEPVPPPQPIKSKRPEPKVIGPAMVQIGVFSSEARAQAAWVQARSASQALQGKFMQIDTVANGTRSLYRLRVAVGRPAVAATVCADLARAALQCVAVTK